MPWSAPLVMPGVAVDLSRPHDLSLKVRFDDAPSGRAFSLPGARAEPVAVGGFLGDVRRGGSCNCETHELSTHGAGTHTEGVGHLLAARVPVIELCDEALLPALVVTVTPERLEEVPDEVAGNQHPDDRVIARFALEDAIDAAGARAPLGFAARALVVRTADYGAERDAVRFSGTNPAYFTLDAMEEVRARGFDHLLVDLPSLDREDDGGLLGAHRVFFDLGPRQIDLAGAPPRRTVTELVAVGRDVEDGGYALSLQLAPLVADAVPSRPLLFPLVVASPSWNRR